MNMAHFVVRKKLPKLKSYIIVFSVSSTRNFYQSTFATFVATYSEDPNKSSELIVILWKFLPAEKAYFGLNYYQFFFSFPTAQMSLQNNNNYQNQSTIITRKCWNHGTCLVPA